MGMWGKVMELIDNKAKLLGDDLKREIKPGAKLKIVASYFSIYAFEALKRELSGLFPRRAASPEAGEGGVRKTRSSKTLLSDRPVLFLYAGN